MLNDADFDSLEAYLDDAMSPDEVVRLDRRLAAEPELSGALDGLRRDRALRRAAFGATAPSDPNVSRFTDSLLKTLRRRESVGSARRILRTMGALAACTVVGFLTGWAGHQHPKSPATAATPASSHQAAASPTRPDTHLAAHLPHTGEAGQFQVAVLDENGDIVAVQPFSRLEDAKAFADDLAVYEARREQVRQSQAMLISDRF